MKYSYLSSMKLLKFYPYLMVFFISFFVISCTKESIPPSPVVLYSEEATKFLKTAASDADAPYFISGEFNGTRLYCATTNSDQYAYHDTIYNLIAFEPSREQDNIHLLRVNKEGTVKLAMYFTNSRIFSRTLPYNLPYQNILFGEFAEIAITDLKGLHNSSVVDDQREFLFSGSTFNVVSVQVLSLTDSTMRGTFSGNITNYRGAHIRIRDGAFNIRLKSMF